MLPREHQIPPHLVQLVSLFTHHESTFEKEQRLKFSQVSSHSKIKTKFKKAKVVAQVKLQI